MNPALTEFLLCASIAFLICMAACGVARLLLLREERRQHYRRLEAALRCARKAGEERL